MLISTIKVGRAKRGCACFCTLASGSTSVLIYVLIKIHAVLFCITYKNQRAVYHFQVTRYMHKKQTMFIISYNSRLCTTTTTAVQAPVFKGQISAIEVGRAKRGCACFRTLASESTSVLIYVLIIKYTLYCFVLLIKISELYIISKSHGTCTKNRLCSSFPTTAGYVLLLLLYRHQCSRGKYRRSKSGVRDEAVLVFVPLHRSRPLY